MSKSPLLSDDLTIEDLEDRELLERIAAMDPDRHPIASRARAVIDQADDREGQEGSS